MLGLPESSVRIYDIIFATSFTPLYFIRISTRKKCYRNACRNLLKVFGESTVSDRTCRRWYEKFETGDFDLSDKPRSGRPSLIDDDVVKAMLE
ncbi:histone-lysine N-methyltransferase SETMAR-like [Apis mellifera caucasica]|nr:histone-lysine N-methyltransferase SETMAR-like [Apis mellifera caucasica]